jgi:hypothetical protein
MYWFKANWKAVVVVALVVGAVLFAGLRLRGALGQEKLPTWLRFREHSSPALPRAAYAQFLAAQRAAEREGEQRRRAVAAIRFVELAEDPSESVLWSTEKITNLGYDVMQRVERAGVPSAGLIGYYTADGQPIRFTTRHQPQYPDSVPATLQLSRTLAPGASETIIRRERYPLQLQASNNQGFELPLQLPPSGRGVGMHVRAIWLGKGAELLKCQPDQGVFVSRENGPLVVWFDQHGIVPRLTFSRH